MNIEKSLSNARKIVALATDIIILLYWLSKLQISTTLFS